MSRLVLGVFLGLLLGGVGIYWWQGSAQVGIKAPPPPDVGDAPAAGELPLADGHGLEGPAPPEASGLTREQRRFFRYDRNRDLSISRNEMLSTRSEGFRKLDVDGNNLLTFEEWAVTTVERFEGSDADGNGKLTAKEFAATAPKPLKTGGAACRC